MAHQISQYLSVRQVYFPSFTSDSRRIAFLTDITGVPQVWEVSVPEDQPEPLWPDQRTFEADRVMGVWCSPAPGDARIVCARDAGGNENAQLFLLSPGEGEERRLTGGHDTAKHIFGEWSHDGSRILFAANRRNRGRFDLYLQELEDAARLVWQHDEPGALTRQTFSPDERRVAVVRESSSFRHDLFEIDLATGAGRALAPSAEDARYHDVVYAADGRSLYVTTDQGSDFLHIARLDLETLRLEPMVTPDWDVEIATRSPDGRMLAYTVNENGLSKLYRLDLESGTSRPAPPFDTSPGVVGYFDARLDFSADSRRLAFSYTSAMRASDIFIWDLEANSVSRITRTSHAGLTADQFVPPELIHYPTFDGREIPAWYFRPRSTGAERLPAVISVHGGPEGQFVPYFNFLVQYLIENGYAVLAPNVRGSTGYGKAYSHLDDVEKRMDSVADLAHAARWLQGRTEIDSSRLVVYGGSYGGFMVLAALTAYPELWAAGVDIVGISNLRTFLENTSDYRRAHREAEYGSLARDREFLESIAPINHVDKLRAPLMVIHGANDPRVPLSEAEQLVAALKQRNVPVECLVFDDEGHGIVKLKNKLVTFPAIIDFLRKHL